MKYIVPIIAILAFCAIYIFSSLSQKEMAP